MTDLTRRAFLRAAGMTTASAVVLAACSDDRDGERADDDGTDGADGAAGAADDVTTLRTASSLEAAALGIYDTGIESGLVTTPQIREAVDLFRSEHEQHAELFSGTTEDIGGEPFKGANPMLVGVDVLTDERSVVQMLYEIEVALAQSYQGFVGSFDDESFNQVSMTVGGAEARHAAVLAGFLTIAPAQSAFQPTDAAIASGEGLDAGGTVG